MPYVIPLTALFTAGALELVQWGQGRFNWGPRMGALLLLVFGQIAFTGNVVGSWLRQGVSLLAGWADTGVSYLLGSGAGNAVAYLIHWLPAALLGFYWLAAMSPWGFKERMTWRLAWAGLLLPAFITAVPGPAGHFLSWIFGLLTDLGAGIIGRLFGLA